METLIHYFDTISSTHRAAILAGGIAFFWIIESGFPLFRFKYSKWKHAGINIFFTTTTILVNFLLAFLLVMAINWTTVANFGFLNWLPDIHMVLYTLLGLLVLDLVGAYTVHWVEHKIRWMWKFHLIHHTDPNVDTTTANRHHPGESVFRFVFTFVAVLISGAPFWLVMLYQSLSVLLSQFNHANIQLPFWADRMISLFLVTPNMHHVHHHYILPYTDSNYGNLFSIWDRLFGTYRSLKPGELIYGIDTHSDFKDHSNINSMLIMPFSKYRLPVRSKGMSGEK